MTAQINSRFENSTILLSNTCSLSRVRALVMRWPQRACVWSLRPESLQDSTYMFLTTACAHVTTSARVTRENVRVENYSRNPTKAANTSTVHGVDLQLTSVRRVTLLVPPNCLLRRISF